MVNRNFKRIAERLGRKDLPREAIPEVSNSNITPTYNLDNPAGFVILEGREHGDYVYPDVLIAKDKILYGESHSIASQKLDDEDFSMLNLRQYVDFLNLLRSGTVFDGNGKKLSGIDINVILGDIFLPPAVCTEGEWLDNYYDISGGSVRYGMPTSEGPCHRAVVHENLDTNYLRQIRNELTGIDHDEWLSGATPQGFPPSEIAEGNLLYYHPPVKGKATRFIAYAPAHVVLECNADHSVIEEHLGVRPSKIKL